MSTELYSGQHLSLSRDDDNLSTLVFDSENSAVNTLSKAVLQELGDAVNALRRDGASRALIMRSAKASGFFVGADINEFVPMFAAPSTEVRSMLDGVNQLFNSIEDLPFPTLACVHGNALGSGCELALSCDFIMVDKSAKIGLPEVKLGIMPGWGGSVRLPRLIGYDNALEWIATGAVKGSKDLIKHGLADAIVELENWDEAAKQLIADCEAGDFDYRARRNRKLQPLKISDIERRMATESARGMILSKAGPHYPSPPTILKVMDQQVILDREAALALESDAFVMLSKQPVTEQLIGIFRKDQAVKRKSKQLAKTVAPVAKMAVLGAGIMGGGIAYQAASRKVSVIMKDIADEALAGGQAEAARLTMGQVGRGKLKQAAAVKLLQSITPSKSYGDFADVELVVEAVTENPKIKSQVLAQCEAEISETAVLTSNTSTISIDRLAEALQRPEQFCGMHFFNPVHRMPLVEVIRGSKSSEATIARTVSLALSMGKTPVVVNDCPGFLVNRCLFPYYGAFDLLLQEGVDYRYIDKAASKFGWPMGPAHLGDVIGLDTMVHASDVMAEGFPDRNKPASETKLMSLFDAKRLGQKAEAGFYDWKADKRGKAKHSVSQTAIDLVYGKQTPHTDISVDSINNRLMLALAFEAVRCLQDDIVASAQELDIAMIYGVGFPPHLGGPIAWLDAIGAAQICEMAKEYESLGGLYAIPELLAQHGKNNTKFLSSEA